MLRIATLAALGALVAAPAFAAPATSSVSINTAGKSPAQLQGEVRKAAVQVCRAEYDNTGLDAYLRSSCIQDTTRTAMSQLALSNGEKVASR